MVRWNVTFFGLAAGAGGNFAGSSRLVQLVALSFPHSSGIARHLPPVSPKKMFDTHGATTKAAGIREGRRGFWSV